MNLASVISYSLQNGDAKESKRESFLLFLYFSIEILDCFSLMIVLWFIGKAPA